MIQKVTSQTLASNPAFISVDDAARYVHARIGARRDIEFGSIIFQRLADQLFVASEPVAGEGMTFSFSSLLELSQTDAQFIDPPGYRAFATVHSHPDSVETTLSQNPHITRQQAHAFVSFYSGADIAFNHRFHKQFKADYLSGPDGTLMKYQPSGSVDEAGFANWLLTRGEPTSPHATDGSVEGIFKKLASVGQLVFLQSSSTWGGSVGQVPDNWVVYKPFVSAAATEQPALTAVFSQAAAAVIDALSSPSTSTSVSRVGFLLKHRSRDNYVATLPNATRSFSPEDIFPKRPDGKVRLPSQFRLKGIFFSQPDQPAPVATREPWLASAFFSPAQVVAAIRQGQSTLPLQNPSHGLDLYMRAHDDALLKLKVPSAALVTELFKPDSDGVISDNGAQAALVAGTLTPRNYVRRVIEATELWVVQAGKLWRDVGRVDTHSPLLAPKYPLAFDRSFLSARDAALHAHEQIGSRRSRYYGGYVLKGADGRFVVTPPLESMGHPFSSTLFFPVGDQGALIPMEDYELHARYGSHTALSMVDPNWVKQRGWTQEEALINLQVFSDDEMYSIISDERVAYLSGAQDCLLEYAPNQSPQEQLLLANIGPPAGENRLGRRLDRGEIRPADWVRRLAVAGEFKIIQGNPLWGPRGVVYSDWSPNFTYAPRFGPLDYVLYGAVFSSGDDAARSLHTRLQGRTVAEPACYAYILKHKDLPQYIATEAVGAVNAGELFKFNRLFARNLREPVLPEGYEMHALFRSQHWSPPWLKGANTWLTQYFVMPGVLLVALTEGLRGRAQSLPVYFSNLDGALLRYQPSLIDVQAGGLADNLLGLASTQLDSGKKTALEFVREWIAKGMLYVVRSSQFWDTSGQVKPTWNGYETLTPRRLSPAFASPDDAARHAAVAVGSRQRRTYGGVILRLANGLFVATEPLVVPAQGPTLDWIYPDPVIATGLYPGGATLVAFYQSRMEQEVQILLSAAQKAIYQSMIPTAVLGRLLAREAHIKRQYVFGPNGSILSYQLTDDVEETLLKNKLAATTPGAGDLSDNPIERQLRSGALLPQAFIDQVARAGDMRVVEGSAVWGSPRRIQTGFVPNQDRAAPLAVRDVGADSPCGPIFTRALDAVRHVYRNWNAGAQVAVGYVLKAFGKELYMTTLPLVRERYDDLNPVFVKGQLPQGYVLAGLYLCASTETIAAADDEMARHFFAPPAISKALSFMTTPRNGGALPLYLLCADGALLWYTVPKTAPVSEWASNVSHDSARLRDGSLTVRDYVRRLAAMGELHIRVTSEIWGRKERVTTLWWPKRPPHSFTADPYFHSFCGPLFFYADDAARYAQRLIAPFAGKPYLGAVLMPAKMTGFVAIDPVEDRPGFGNSTLELLFWTGHAGFDVPAGKVLRSYKIAALHAFYKSIPSRPNLKPLDLILLPNFVSSEVLNSYLSVVLSNQPDAERIYLSCQGGALLKYIPALTAAESTILSARPAPSPSALVSRLRQLGSLSVLVTDAFWRKRGPLGDEWAAIDPDAGEPWYGHQKDEL
ncbi:DUF4329 domain-containing protein [Pseudomonas trivialis]|uniref:Uncharacterized protein n=1 Tax=Pseudomonas trivialis TaxID=200450 RepID=A0A0H5AQT7_9PSED|nr:DUF4329 domain-containing protein [Pseudomonas trivialis]AKS06637.1 hypothetical protein AA957_11105 [Pseudomonas trivialis]